MYLIGPLVGAGIAVGCAWILRGHGGDPTSVAAGSGVLRRGHAATVPRHEHGIAHELDPHLHHSKDAGPDGS